MLKIAGAKESVPAFFVCKENRFCHTGRRQLFFAFPGKYFIMEYIVYAKKMPEEEGTGRKEQTNT